jgi:cystathionine gamma-lyase
MEQPTYADGTRVVHAGVPPAQEGHPFLPGPTFAAPFHFAGAMQDTPYVYGRYDNPTWGAYEQALGELEGGEAVLFASGMAAVTGVLLTVLKPGSVLVMPTDSYYTGRRFAEGYLADRGVSVRFVPTAGDGHREALDGATLLWLETPSNPTLDVCDIAALAEAAHRAGALVAVDNTTATPLGQRPLELGADFSVASDTKAMTGHSDLILGHVATRDPARTQELRGWRSGSGAIPGPMEVWLAHRSLATLELRLSRQCASAQALAEMLQDRPEVELVRYPGLTSDPSAPLAARQMRRYGGVVSFALADRAAADQFLASCRLIAQATSFGGVHSSAERRARHGGDDVAEGFIRLSVGVEDTGDLLADVAQALDGLAGH